MRRVFGTTGIPEEIPFMIGTQTPILDLTDADIVANLQGRVVYVNLWVYVSGVTPAIDAGPLPDFWNDQFDVGSGKVRPNYNLDPTLGPASPILCVLTSDETNLEDAVNSSRKILCAEANVLEITTDYDRFNPPVSNTNISMLQPTQILSDYAMAPGDCLFVTHNMDTTTCTIYAWGYYTVQEIGNSPGSVRPLQPDPDEVRTTFAPITVTSGQTKVVHTVSEDYTDEVTIDFRVSGNGGTPASAGDGLINIEIENGPSIEVYAGLTLSDTYPGFSALTRFFDGIPMKGAGEIRFIRGVTPGQVQITGSFKRY